MYRWEISWEEKVEGCKFPIPKFKGFTSEEKYRKFLKRLQKKGCKITGRIEDGRTVA